MSLLRLVREPISDPDHDALIELTAVMVRCPACGSEIAPPSTGIGRRMWMVSELNCNVTCIACGTESRVPGANNDN